MCIIHKFGRERVVKVNFFIEVFSKRLSLNIIEEIKLSLMYTTEE